MYYVHDVLMTITIIIVLSMRIGCSYQLVHHSYLSYTRALGAWVVVALIDFLVALAVVLVAKKKDFPVPDLVHYLTLHFAFCPCVGKGVKNTYLIQILAVWHTLAALQIACFHAIFVFVAFIAQPLHTALTMIFYAAMVFCLTTTFMLLYASFHAGHYVSLKKGG